MDSEAGRSGTFGRSYASARAGQVLKVRVNTESNEHGIGLDIEISAIETLGDLARALRQLKRRHARQTCDSELTIRELASRTGYATGAIGSYFNGTTLAPTEKFDALTQLLGATAEEQRILATARDRIADRPKSRTAISDNQLPGAASGSDAGNSDPSVTKTDAADPRNDVPRPLNRPVIVGNVPHELQPYQQRTDLLAKLDRPVGGRIPIVHVLTGMSGAGKTHLAAEYARARINDRWRLVAWIEAENEIALLSGLADIASESGLATQPDARTAGQAVRHWLEADGERRLLVFDGAANLDALRPFVPAAGDARILITSNEDSMASLGVRVPVDIFTREEALAYLAMRVERSDPVPAGELAAELGRLPLALAQAAAVIATDGYDAYLDRLHKEPVDELLLPGQGDPYPRGVAAAIQVALDAAGSSDDTLACRPLMEVISLLSVAGIPRALLHVAGRSGVLATEAGSEVHPSAVDKALAKLAGMSLLTFSGDRGHVSAHPLVMRVVRERLTRQGRFEPVCCAVSEMLTHQADLVRQAWERSTVRKHVDQMLALYENVRHRPEKLGEELVRRMLRLRLEIARFQDDLGDNAASAIHEGEDLLADTERVLGAGDRWTLYARHNLAVAYQQAGLDADAIALHERNLAERERILGADHRDTCASRNNLGIAYQDAGRVSDAIALHEENLAYREQNFGTDDRDTCASRNNLAIAYQDVGSISDAIALHEKNVSYMEQSLGVVGHPDVLPRLHGFGNAYYVAGRAGDVIALRDSILADGERVIGTSHPDRLGYENNLATAYLQSGRLSDAITWLERNLSEKEGLLGAKHPRTQTSRNNLAVAYLKTGRNDEAIGLLEDAVAVLDPVVGYDHRTAQIVHRNLAVAMGAKARDSQTRFPAERGIVNS